MKAIINVSSGSYGFGHNWSLVVTNKKGEEKSFYLGQDVKFCRRVLGMEPRYIVEQIGSNDLGDDNTLRKLGKFIVNELGLTESKLNKAEAWSLCAE